MAGETIVAAMLGGFLAAVVIGYTTLRVIGEWTAVDTVMMVLGVFVIGGYITPRLAAWWLGKCLDEMMGWPPRNGKTEQEKRDRADAFRKYRENLRNASSDTE